MAVTIPDDAVRRVAACFAPAIVRDGLARAAAGDVHLVKPPPWPVVARVTGGGGHVVTVHFEPHGGALRGECTCPAAGDCAHAAATALVAFAVDDARGADAAAAAHQAQVGAWLADLGRIERDPGAPAAGDRVVAYVLDARADDPGDVGLTAVQATRLRKGGLGAGQAIAALADPMRGAPRWVEVSDLRRIAMLRAVSRAPADTTRLRVDRLHGDQLRELADAGALFWQSTRSDPLRWGEPLADRLGWRDAGAGACRLGPIGPAADVVVIPARDAHYVDPAAGVIGPLDLGVSVELLGRLLAGPAVPAAMRATVDRSLAPLLGEAAATAAPRPATAPEPMRPALHAFLDDDDPAERHHVQLAASALYGDDELPLGAWDPARPIARDLVAEGRARARLDALIARLPHGARASSSLHALADARHVAHVIVPALRAEGWRCTLADDFPHEAPLDDVAFVERLRPVADSYGWFELELGVTVAGRTVPLLPILLQAIRDGQVVLGPDGAGVPAGAGLNLTLPEGELVHVPAERLARWLRPLLELGLGGADALDADTGALRLPAPAAAALDDGADAPGLRASLDAARARLDALLALAPRAAGDGFAGALRPYQAIGHGWLRTLHDAGLGGLLADEMGLGKTIQVLAFLDGLAADGALGPGAPALVVAPRSVVGNWQREAARFAPRLGAVLHVGGGRDDAPSALARAPLVITSYQTMVRDLELLREVRWTTVLLDEAQVVKNPDTQARAAAAALTATSRFAITGTPIENHLGELWSELDLAVPGVLGRRAAFDAIYRRPVEKFGATAPLEALRQRVRPFLLRRTKAAVEVDLPPKTEVVERIELEPAQRDLYETLRLRVDADVREALGKKGIAGASIAILDALLQLRQCCCDPRLVRHPEARQVRASAKLDRVVTMLEELAGSGRRVLVFSQFATMLGLIEQACARADVPTAKLTGKTRDRDGVVRRFQAGGAPVLLVSLKAGGVGLNLTAADTVIHYDPWWNPAAEAQATDRAHRIGQDRPVHVYKLVARGTLEETILELQDDKRRLTDATLAGAGVTKLSADDLHALYQRVV